MAFFISGVYICLPGPVSAGETATPVLGVALGAFALREHVDVCEQDTLGWHSRWRLSGPPSVRPRQQSSDPVLLRPHALACLPVLKPLPESPLPASTHTQALTLHTPADLCPLWSVHSPHTEDRGTEIQSLQFHSSPASVDTLPRSGCERLTVHVDAAQPGGLS